MPSRLSWPSRLSSLVACVFVFIPSSSHAQQPPRDAVQRTGRSIIRGRVLAVESGAPIRHATVRISAPSIQGARTTSSDAEGRYEFRDLAASTYQVSVSKPAYVNWAYGQTRPNGGGKPIALRDNEVADHVDVRLPRGAVITGRVVDEFGEPVASANVNAMRQTYSQGQRQLNQFNQAQTNDIGEYRIFGLTPGQYYVSATAQAMLFVEPTPDGFRTPGEHNGFAPAFYPGTADVGAAQRLTVGLAETLSGIDIALVPARLATIRGVALDAQGRAPTNGAVQLIRRGAGNFVGPGGVGMVRPDGTFGIPNVAPGEYILRANLFRPAQTPGTAPGGPPEVLVALVSVNGDDVTGIRLAPVTQVAVTGRILFDDASAAQSVKASMLRVMSIVINPDDSPMGFGFGGGLPDSTVHDDFTFELKTYPGRIGLRAFAPALPNGNSAGNWQIKAIRANGADVTDAAIDLGNQGLSGVEIELTNRVQQLTGTVADAKGDLVKDYTVAVFAQDRARWVSPTNRYSAISRASAEGTFKVTTLPPGEYYAVAVEGLDLSNWQDPDSLERLSRLATPFALTAGDTRTLDLKLAE